MNYIYFYSVATYWFKEGFVLGEGTFSSSKIPPNKKIINYFFPKLLLKLNIYSFFLNTEID